jgi:aminoglycoside phosphotransferase (APT) family kinase protein
MSDPGRNGDPETGSRVGPAPTVGPVRGLDTGHDSDWCAVLAEGRDSEIVAYGPGLVLRRPKRPRPLDDEAEIMRWVADRGFPCPTVVELVPDGLVMERIEGVSMLDEVVSHPWRARRYAGVLADLHDRLHQLAAPDGLREPFGPGRALVHGDLHPGNVMLTADGPLVIDWTNAARGPGAADVAVSWLLMAAADAPGSPMERIAIAGFRRVFVRFFLARAGRDEAAACLEAALAHRLGDPNLSAGEIERATRLVERHSPS